MRNYPDSKDEDDQQYVAKLNAEDWQLELLKLNPEYTYWGNFEDYMSGKDNGWATSQVEPDWKTHIEGWGTELNDYNEIVNFYFEVYRKNHECPHCEGSNLNPQTKQLSNDWYDFEKTGRMWSSKLTEIEVEALVKGGRISNLLDSWYRFEEEENQWYNLDQTLPYDKREWVKCAQPTYPTPQQVNEWNNSRGFGHDAINQWICVEARAKHLGFYGHCEHCVEGYIYDEPKAKVALQLWYLHPRKGCSKGVYIENINQEDLDQVFEYLNSAARRNQNRFSGIVNKFSIV